MKRISFFISLLFLSTAAMAASADPIEKIAKELADGLTQYPKAKVAVVGITHYQNYVCDAPQMVSERMTTYLAKDRRLRVIERDHIVQILSELHLSETGMMDPAAAERIGKMLGADIIITGLLIDLNNKETEFNARALISGTGRVISASRGTLERTWAVPNRLESVKK